jgi:dihydrofolate reductase
MSRLGGTEGIYGGAWTGPVFVLTHQPPSAWDNRAITFLSDGLENAIATALRAAKRKNVTLFGPTFPGQCLAAGLLDEIRIHLVPTLLGEGVRLCGGPGMGRVKLQRTYVGQSGQVTDVQFRVLK